MKLFVVLLLIGSVPTVFSADYGENLRGECIYSPSNSRKADVQTSKKEDKKETSKAAGK
tara:strand:- start:1132 stop:1308 length:177 start_codon:yes stop_codon:yes gene_type:complete